MAAHEIPITGYDSKLLERVEVCRKYDGLSLRKAFAV